MASSSSSTQATFGLGRRKKNPGLLDQIGKFFGGDKKRKSKVRMQRRVEMEKARLLSCIILLHSLCFNIWFCRSYKKFAKLIFLTIHFFSESTRYRTWLVFNKSPLDIDFSFGFFHYKEAVIYFFVSKILFFVLLVSITLNGTDISSILFCSIYLLQMLNGRCELVAAIKLEFVKWNF